MSTGLIIALILIVVAVLVVAAVLSLRARGPQRGRSLKRRFGPEYDRAVARHDGDDKAAERELTERVERHGSLREHSLEPAQLQQFEARWTAAQERFVDSPREAVAEADRLLADLAEARGFPAGDQYDEQFAALSVHHAHRVHGYRRVHRAARAGVGAGLDGDARANTEEMREAMVEARALFDDLIGSGSGHREGHREERSRTQDTSAPQKQHGHAPWAFTKRQAKGS
ncbi:hypothetical protein ABZ896_01255 [Streptomyces sp. NPDC047072]|uniref:hypothetical protein n=1 Tax=Streptomyces sp. NPDC047072 TaxID=3154809 RepID=UPI0033D1FF9B